MPKLSNLPSLTDTTGSEFLYIIYNGKSYKIDIDDLPAGSGGGGGSGYATISELVDDIQTAGADATEGPQLGDAVRQGLLATFNAGGTNALAQLSWLTGDMVALSQAQAGDVLIALATASQADRQTFLDALFASIVNEGEVVKVGASNVTDGVSLTISDIEDTEEAAAGTIYAAGLQATHDAGGGAGAAADATIALMAGAGGEAIEPAEDTDHWTNTPGLIIATPQSLGEAEVEQVITPSAGSLTISGGKWNYYTELVANTSVDVMSGLTMKPRYLRAFANGGSWDIDFPAADVGIAFDTTVTIASGKVASFAMWENADGDVFVQYDGQQDLVASGTATTATTTETITGTDTTKAVTADGLAALWEQGSNVAAGSTTTLGEGGYFTITGNTGITAFAFTTDKAGRAARLRFTGTPAVTHNATSLILPGGASITMVAGATATIVSLGGGNFVMTEYSPGGVTGTGSSVLATSPALVTPDLGTPSAINLTNATALPVSAITASTSTAIGVGSINLGHASDTTIARSGPGAITVEGVQVILSGAALGTPSSGTLSNCTAADTSAKGVSELATIAEVNVGTDTARTVCVDALAGSYAGTFIVELEVFGPLLDVTTGDGKAYFYTPPSLNGMDLVACGATVITAGTTGTTDIQIANATDSVDVLSTKITIDSTEKTGGTSTFQGTAAAAAVINTSNDDIATSDVWRIDVDAVSTTAPKGLMVAMEFRLP